MMRWGDKPYYSLDWYLKQTYGFKIYKIALDAGFTCPNRDGHVGISGCIFCSAGGSGDYAGDRRLPIDEQLTQGILRKRAVLNHLHHELRVKGVWQGCRRGC